ncbi:MAG: hypothetical protein QM704_21260 [Anaeromyxobacteraceae bacterium]
MRLSPFLLAGLAAAGCASARARPASAPEPAPEIAPFTTDGCSLFPDRRLVLSGDWCDCCVRHDLAYWRGGTEADRLAADEALRACVRERTGDPVLAEGMFVGVRAGGTPAFPTTFRWGYGWPPGRGYAPLTPAERRAVDAAMAAVRRTNPDLTCKGAGVNAR